MRIKEITIQEIIDFLGKHVLIIYGPKNGHIDNLADSIHTNESSLDWVNATKDNKQIIVEKSPAKVILVDITVNYSEVLEQQNKTLIVVDNPKIALAKIGNAFFSDLKVPGIHSSCVVDPNCELAEDISVGPFSFIGKAKIGKGTIIGSNVRIYDDVKIGNHCRIKDGAVIGGEGFGFERDENGNLFRFPQIGDVLIGDHVEIGANTCIDRGALSTTKIGDYTKINNLCHIAHNNVIGKNVVIAAEVNISGGNMIEDDCWIAPSASIRGYIHVGKGSTIGMGAVVVKDIPEGEVWAGSPERMLRDK